MFFVAHGLLTLGAVAMAVDYPESVSGPLDSSFI